MEKVRALCTIFSFEAYLAIVGDDIIIYTGVKFYMNGNFLMKIFGDATDIVGTLIVKNQSFIGINIIPVRSGFPKIMCYLT